jgi:integrase
MSNSTPTPEPREAAEAGQPKPPRVKKSWTVAGFRIQKPYPDFPLTPHASGTWQKKIRGRVHYFGRWACVVGGKLVRVEGGWQEALELYKAQADDLHAGRTPRVQGDALTIADLCNRFLTAKQRQYEAGEISAVMYKPGPTPEQATGEYKATTDRLVSMFGRTRPVSDLAADDFEALRDALAKQYGPVRLGNEIQKVRSVFKYALESGLIDRPVRYGPQFKKPAASVLRRHRAKNGKKMLEAAEVRRILDALAGKEVETGRPDEETGEPETVTLRPNPALRAMVFLGVNCGLGNHDCSLLPPSAADRERGWLDYPRPKTGIARRCPLWPETVEAIREALASRPGPAAGEADRVFLTARNTPWIHVTPAGGRDDNIAIQFGLLLKRIGLHRPGLGFYTLRHVFRTVADAARDPVAVDLIMGHADPSMGARYRERIEDGRLQAVVEHVRRWLFDEGPGDGATEPEETAPKAAPAPRPKRDAGKDRPKLRLFAG